MLINKGVSPGEVVTIKLTSGEEIVAKLILENATILKVTNPVVLAMGAQGVSMIPYLITVDRDKEVSLNRNSVVVLEITEKTAANQYIKATTGIALVS